MKTEPPRIGSGAGSIHELTRIKDTKEKTQRKDTREKPQITQIDTDLKTGTEKEPRI